MDLDLRGGALGVGEGDVDLATLTQALMEPDVDLAAPSELYERKRDRQRQKRQREAASTSASASAKRQKKGTSAHNQDNKTTEGQTTEGATEGQSEAESSDANGSRFASTVFEKPDRELVAQTRRRSERNIKDHRRMVQDIKRTQTLRRAMIPRTRMNKHQLRRKKDDGFRVLRRVEDVHASVESMLRKQVRDARDQLALVVQRGGGQTKVRNALATAERQLQTYLTNYTAWKEARMMSLVRASEDDSREQMALERETLERENARARREHILKMQPTLDVLGFEVPHHFTDRVVTKAPRTPVVRSGLERSGQGRRSKGGEGTPTLMQFFPRRPDACKREVERVFRECYLERVSETFDFLIQDWPEYKPIKTEEEEARERERVLKEKRRSQMRCSSCDCNMVIDNKHALLMCPQCGECVEGAAEVAFQQTFSESQATVRSAAPYERLAHFKEFIVRLEGAERTEIPEIVINVLLRQCMAHNIDPRAQPERITYHLVRDFLQKTKYAHFFENIPQIMSLLTGQPPMRFTDEEKAKLTQIFKEIQEPFQKHKGTRKNFLSYSYTTFKSCELLGIRRFLPLLPLLKAPLNLLAADRIWEKICEDCGYEFVHTI